MRITTLLFAILLLGLGSTLGCAAEGEDRYPPTSGGGQKPGGSGAGGDGGAAREAGAGGLVAGARFVATPAIQIGSGAVATVSFEASASSRAKVSWRTDAGATGSASVSEAATSFAIVIGALVPDTAHTLTVELLDPPSSRVTDRAQLELTPPPLSRRRVLFDAAHGQIAGNADWVVDEAYLREPEPAEPIDAASWSGAYSAFGFELHRTGRFEIRTLPLGALVAAAELDGTSVLVLPEPNNLYGRGEKEAIWSFVRAGGGLLLLANHDGSDRDFDGFDGADCADDLLIAAGAELGLRVLPRDIEREDPTRALGDHLLLRGPFGKVSALTFFNASLVTASAPAVKLASRSSATSELLAASSTLGEGRVVVVGDSAAVDDGTGHPEKQLFDGWSDHDNAAFYLNVVSWLAKEY